MINRDITFAGEKAFGLLDHSKVKDGPVVIKLISPGHNGREAAHKIINNKFDLICSLLEKESVPIRKKELNRKLNTHYSK